LNRIMPSLHAVGIDVGAASSVMAWINGAHSEILPDLEGNRLVPSLVLFDDRRTIAGEEARLRGERQPDRLAASAKLSLGKPLHDAPVRGEQFPPEVIHACLLSKLRREIEGRLGADYKAVLTVPAFFGELRRKAVADAAEIAGLPLADLLNEPTAAALAFGEHTGYLSAAGVPLQWLKALVFNLNAATFEATLLEISPGGIKTLAVDGDLHLGGSCWDERLADCAAEQFIRKYGVDPREDPTAHAQILARVERAKYALSLRPAAHFDVEYDGRSLEVNVAREQFVHATLDLLERTTEIAERTLASAGAAWPLVDRVFLVGGATQMPMIRERLRGATGRDPDYTVHPKEAVARGAALYARSLLKKAPQAGPESLLRVTQVATRSVGILGVDPKTGAKINKVLIRRGAPLPATATEKFVIHPGRTPEIVITVLEGESRDAAECEVVGKAIIRDLPGDLAEEWPVAVTYECTPAGRLVVDARLCYTDRKVHLELSHAVGLSAVQRERWREIVAAESPFAAFQAELHRKRSVPIAYAASEPEPSEKPPKETPSEHESLLGRARHWLHTLSPHREQESESVSGG
jgi:molecular chaperone DnaK